ncbi:hypothetical protein SDRG_00700 [Saprolegnia diclina VS20]|uniref:K Homology domain-containing protein n=1 Tax=Saprolegnia diclina (strain VS20) TaxID=1156394 RepID=T0R4E4_SAPDV|nr:hypothetical protein SDRG_00700 [Saprolegnia diclina VS20]EQC41841.1 hypothetical protein SDRG_00700 [Saprolegnia diclina VS20]|eukprot:XP_008604410.1 hypothetical protein SDRG_00700 [Saprolegnia diclina VS20]
MADNDPVAKARAIAARLGLTVPSDNSILGKRKNRFDDDMDGRKKKKVYIPVEKYPDINFMGLLIGPRGSNQKRMEDLSGSRILIRGRGSVKESFGDPDENDDMHVLITADTDDQIAKAQELVEDILFNPEKAMKLKQEQLRQVAENNGSTEITHYGPLGGGIGGETMFKMSVPRALVGLIIGRGGETIRDLQNKSGSHIQVGREDDGGPPTERIVQIAGTPAQVEIARNMINGILGDRVEGGRRDRNEPPPDALKLVVPNDKVGLIIGRQGVTVKGVQQRTGANVVVPSAPDSENPSLRTLIITGTSEAKEAARVEIQMLVNDQQNLLPQGANTIYMQLPNDRVGIVIGRQGANVRAIQERHDCRIQIPNVPDPGSMPEVRTISIAGPTQHAVQMAKAEIDAILLNDSARNYNSNSHYGEQSRGSGTYGTVDPYAPHYQQQYYQQQQQQYQQYQSYYGPAGDATAATTTTTTAGDATAEAAAPDATAATATADPNDPNAYWNGYYEYAAYYGVDAANAAWGVTAAADGSTNAPPAEGTSSETKKEDEAAK